ncbi:MAG: hypothetical protein ABW199_01045, partial [Caulobacterales bacterium]
GTVTLELGLAGVPMVVAYKVDGIAVHMRRFIRVPSIVLANLVIRENIFPEFIQEECTGEKLAGALLPLLSETPERDRQIGGLQRIAGNMLLDGTTPSERAAETAIAVIEQGIKKRLSVPR